MRRCPKPKLRAASTYSRFLRGDRLGANDACIEHPANDGERDIKVQQAGPEHRDNGDHQNQERERDNDIDDTADDRIDPAAVVTGHKTEDGADDQRERDPNRADLQIDARGIDDPREHIAPQMIRAHRMSQGGGFQRIGEINEDGVVGGDQRREDRGQKNEDKTRDPDAQGPVAFGQPGDTGTNRHEGDGRVAHLCNAMRGSSQL